MSHFTNLFKLQVVIMIYSGTQKTMEKMLCEMLSLLVLSKVLFQSLKLHCTIL